MNNEKRIDCFIPYTEATQAAKTVEGLQATGLVNKIHLLMAPDVKENLPGCHSMHTRSLQSSTTMRDIAARTDADYILLYTKGTTLRLGLFALERMMQIAQDSGAGMVYADRYQVSGGKQAIAPVIDYQQGSLRDDFDFGSVLLFDTAAFKEAATLMEEEQYRFAGLYDLRLKLSQKHPLVHINEYLYSEVENDTRKSGEKIFDYVDPRNRHRQIEMERACTDHLKTIGGYLEPLFKKIEFDEGNFEYEASVIIPVRNRIRTIRDAIRSVLNQKADFKFNLIIIDNHSTDGTTEAIDAFADDRLIHIIPERDDLGIGGCWNVGVHHPLCGKFAVQLDSDDVYKDENTLQIMVNAFYEQNCAMVVGTYMMTDFDMNMIPPGIIDHKEWTPENGRNNALRINGLGAPRAFYTPVLREVKVPNTSYGEDYALGLNFSRHYQIGRVYDVVYLCRRWDDNSDASLDIVKMNAHNLYKDRIRTWELEARIRTASPPAPSPKERGSEDTPTKTGKSTITGG